MARTCYYGRITELDTEFGRLMEHLDTSGELENTIVIVSADHGRYVGAHGYDAHNFGAFEDDIRVDFSRSQRCTSVRREVWVPGSSTKDNHPPLF